MRLFSFLKILLLAALLSGCAGRSLIPEEHNPEGKTLLLRVIKDEQNYSTEVLYRFRQNFYKSRIYRHVWTAGRIEGTSWLVQAQYNGYGRIPDWIPHLERGDLIEIAAPKTTGNFDHDGGHFPVVIALHCKGTDTECLEARNAPKIYYGRVGRPLKPGELESLQDPRNFTPFYNEDHELIRPIPR